MSETHILYTHHLRSLLSHWLLKTSLRFCVFTNDFSSTFLSQFFKYSLKLIERTKLNFKVAVQYKQIFPLLQKQSRYLLCPIIFEVNVAKN